MKAQSLKPSAEKSWGLGEVGREVGDSVPQTCSCQPGPGAAPQPNTYLAARRVERVPMGLTRWMAKSPRRL